MQDGKFVVLAVDDDVDIIEALKLVLEANDYAFVSAFTAEEGIKVYKESNPAENKAPVYMLSSVGDDLNKYVDYKELGLDGVLQKPINNDDLLKILKTKLG